MSIIKVTYDLCLTSYAAQKKLKELSNIPVLGFDTETRSVYTNAEIQKAKDLLKDEESIPVESRPLVKLTARSSGLSYPLITKTTHFIFGLSESHSVIIVTNTVSEELLVWYWLSQYQGKLLIHNAVFDLKTMAVRVGMLPKDYEDTQLLAKTFINNAENWKAKTGLKELMGGYYDPKWSLYNQYDIENYKDIDFLQYMAVDGAAVYKLWFQLQTYKEKNKK
jgi:hypothetical protein